CLIILSAHPLAIPLSPPLLPSLLSSPGFPYTTLFRSLLAWGSLRWACRWFDCRPPPQALAKSGAAPADPACNSRQSPAHFCFLVVPRRPKAECRRGSCLLPNR